MKFFVGFTASSLNRPNISIEILPS